MLERLNTEVSPPAPVRPRPASESARRPFSDALRETNAKAPETGDRSPRPEDEIGDVRDMQPVTAVHRTVESHIPVNEVVELHVISKAGQQELVSLPWRLVAGWSLAHATAQRNADGQLAALSLSHHHGLGHLANAVSENAVRNGVPELPDELKLGGQPVGLFSAVSNPDATRTTGRAAHSPIQEAAALSAEVSWQARLIRLMERQGGRSTAWVRDYRLSDEGIPELVGRLRNLVESHGGALERVMVNAREVWNSKT